MNEEIKIGDEVICINTNRSNYLKKGKTYTVNDIEYSGLFKDCIYIQSEPNKCYWYHINLFIKKDSEQIIIELW